MKNLQQVVLGSTLVLALSLGSLGVARAGDDLPAPMDPAPVPASEPAYRSPMGAVWLSIGATVALAGVGSLMIGSGGKEGVRNAGFGLLIAGAVLGPSAGHLYIGNWEHASGYALGRLGMVGVTALAVFIFFTAAPDDRVYPMRGAGIPALVTGIGGYLIFTAYELVGTYDCAREFNRDHGSTFVFSPLVVPPPPKLLSGGLPGFGLGLSGRF